MNTNKCRPATELIVDCDATNEYNAVDSLRSLKAKASKTIDLSKKNIRCRMMLYVDKNIDENTGEYLGPRTPKFAFVD